MTKEQFIDLFIEELAIENADINEKTELYSIDEWDSIGIMLTVGIVSEHFQSKFTNNDFKALTTVLSLMEKIGLEKFDL